MAPFVISVFAFIAVASLVGAAIVIYRDYGPNTSERRLQDMIGADQSKSDPSKLETTELLRKQAFGDRVGSLSHHLAGLAQHFCNPNLLFEQAESPISAETFLGLSLALGALGVAGAAVGRAALPLYPLVAIAFGALPLVWLLLRRRSRFKQFSLQLPDALQLLGRALRSGHSLSSGIHFIVNEMQPPLSTQFGAVWEAHNMGLPLEQALEDMVKRMPDPDLKFFVALVVMQRQTGGDLAEMLDKISYIVLERFKVLGQVKALTGEGRISGVVLMLLPVLLFFTTYHLNRDYVMVLFENDLGKKMLLAAIVLQVLGAVTIKKIVDIKV